MVDRNYDLIKPHPLIEIMQENEPMVNILESVALFGLMHDLENDNLAD
jgi:hypothetical protein